MVATRASVSSRFDSTTSPNADRYEDWKRLSEECESSQYAKSLSLAIAAGADVGLFLVTGTMGGPYFAEMASTMSSAVSPSVRSRSYVTTIRKSWPL